MNHKHTPKSRLVKELKDLRSRIAEFEKAEIQPKRTEESLQESEERYQEALRRSEERYRNILDSIEEGYYEVDLAGNFTFFNDSLCSLLGYSRDELMGMNNRQYTDEENAAKLYKAFNEVYKTGIPIKGFDYQMTRRDGTKGYAEVSVSPIQDGEGKIIGFRGIARDITDRKRLEDAIEDLSIKDELTGLYNRRGFLALAGQGIKAAKRNRSEGVLIYGDLDNLKEINDTLGHHEGDQVLVGLSQVFKQTFRESDILARLGGDEFGVLAMNCSAISAEKLIDRFKNALHDYNIQRKQPYFLSMSFGIAWFSPQNYSSVEALISQADRMMHESKQKRKTIVGGVKKDPAFIARF